MFYADISTSVSVTKASLSFILMVSIQNLYWMCKQLNP